MKRLFLLISFFVLLIQNSFNQEIKKYYIEKDMKKTVVNQGTMETATFGAGCFWCVEAIFSDLKGVESVKSGYTGGHVKNPSYEAVCTGTTGHAEVCQITYDSQKISYKELLEVFSVIHDPTTLNRQGPDTGTQYRSVIFYHNNKQKEQAEKYKQELDQSGKFADPVVTEISPFTVFYKAEDYHQDYFDHNKTEPYCTVIIDPKVKKFKKQFKEKLK